VTARFVRWIAEEAGSGFSPIIRSLLDTDFYKLLTLQFIWRHFRDVSVTCLLYNRSRQISIADFVTEEELKEQCEHTRSLRFSGEELAWLAGNKFNEVEEIFDPAFVEWLADLRLSPYQILRDGNQWRLSFSGLWAEVTLWEVPAIAILVESLTRGICRSMPGSEIEILFAKAEEKLKSKLTRLREVEGLTFAEFGTRRRHSFSWQHHVIKTLYDEVPGLFTGTSNAYHAMKHGFSVRGTSPHEVPMVLASLARHGSLIGKNGLITLKQSQYESARLWQETYSSIPLMLLPDTWGTSQFLRDAPYDLTSWSGLRVDSKDPIPAGEEYISWLLSHGCDPAEKLLLFSDSLDVDNIISIYKHFTGRIGVSFGWGTSLTNDFRNCHLGDPNLFSPPSLVCKVFQVNGKPAVKLSDNLNKKLGLESEIAHYLEVFGRDGLVMT